MEPMYLLQLLLMSLTGIWVLIGAIKIMPHFADKKMTRKGGKIDKLEQGFHRRLDGIEKKIPKIPVDIPSMGEITTLVEAERKKTTNNLEAVQNAMPAIFVHTMKTKEFSDEISTLVKQHEGRMYRARGIDMQQAQKGIDAAQTVFLDKIQNQDPNHQETNEILLIVKDTLKVAEEGGLIEEGSVDQKMGVVQGVLAIVDKLQKRNNGSRSSSSNQSGGFIPSPPRNFSGGNELDNYYR